MICETIRRVAIRWFVACVIAVGGIACFLNNGFAQEESKRALSGEAYIAAPKDWDEVASSARITALGIVADQTQGNYEKIRTWKGTYHVRMRHYHSAETVQALATELDKPSPLWQESDFAMRFAIDMKSDSIYRSKETREMKWVRDGSNETVTIPNTFPVDERSIVTAEHYLRFDPKVVWPGFVAVRDWPEARKKRAAFRGATEVADRQGLGDLMDPRGFFGLSPSMRLHFHKKLRLLLGAMKGDMGDEVKRKADDVLTVYEAARPGGMWYRLDETLEGPGAGGPANIYLTAIFSPAAGLNAVSLTMAVDKAGERPVKTIQWQWKIFNGVYVPVKVKQLHYSEEDGRLHYDREVDLQESVVNGPLEPSQFTYQGLGMEDGELVMDNINNACYIIENGEPQKLANFREKYVSPGQGSPMTRWLLTVVGAVLLVVFVVASLLLRSRRAKA